MSRQEIEDKLLEAYRSCPYFTQTQQELGRLLSFSGNWKLCMFYFIWCDLYILDWIIKNKERKSSAPSRIITYNTSFLTQFKWVLKRTFRNLMLNPQTSVAQVNTSQSLSFPIEDSQFTIFLCLLIVTKFNTAIGCLFFLLWAVSASSQQSWSHHSLFEGNKVILCTV